MALFRFNQIISNASNEEFTHYDKQLEITNFDKAEIIEDNLYVYEYDLKIYVYNGKSIKIADGTLISIDCFENNIYILLTQNEERYIYIYDLEKEITNSFLVENGIYQKIKVHSNIYIIGSINNDAAILEYTDKGELVAHKNFGGSGEEEFTDLFFINDNIFITGYKDAISYDSCFNNVGNINEKKSFLVRIDKSFEIEKTFYFNNFKSTEKIRSFFYSGNSIHILLACDDLTIQYLFNTNLELISKYSLDNSEYEFIEEIKGVPNDSITLYLAKRNLEYSFVYYDLERYKEYSFKDIKFIFDCKVVNGSLTLLYKDESLHVFQLGHFKILENNDIFITKFYSSMDIKEHFKYISFFSNYNFTMTNIEPIFDKSKTGIYEAVYSANNGIFEDITVNTKVIVDKFVNIIDKGIYPTGYVLEFFGSAKLDGKLIHYGTKVETEGSHILEIIDINNKSIFYEFCVYKDYKFNNLSYTISNAYDVTIGNTQAIFLELKNVGSVKEVIINGEKYKNYSYSNNKLVIVLNSKSCPSIDNYFIDYIITNTDTRMDIKKNITLRTIKDVPNITVNKSTSLNDLSVELKTNSQYLSFMYLEILEYEKLDLVNTKYVYNMNNFKSDYKGITKNIIINYVYTLGDGRLIKRNILDYKLDDNVDITFDKFFISEEKLNVNFKINLPKDKSKIITLKVCDDLYKEIKPNKDFKIKEIMIFSSILLTILFSLIIFLRLRRVKRKIKS